MLKTISTKTTSIIRQRPLVAIISTIALLVTLIAISSAMRRPAEVDTKLDIPVRMVSVYTIGRSPKVRLYGTVEKTGVVTVTSLAPGVISTLPVKEGQRVPKGTVLATLGSNYAGASAALVQRKLAQKQYDLSQSNLSDQSDLISRQRDIATKSRDNTEELRKISEKSLSDTQSNIDLNSSIITSIDKSLATLESTNVGGSQDAAIQALKSQKSQLLSVTNQLRSAYESVKYTTDTSKPPTQLAALSLELTLKQLDIQERSLKVGHEIAYLQLSLATISESLMYPTAPFTAIVQRVYPKVGQAVNPGTPLVALAQVYDEDPATVIVYLDQSTSESLGRGELATIYIDDKPVSVMPSYVTTEPVKGQLYAVYLPVPDSLVERAKEGMSVQVDLPIGQSTGSTVPYVPIQAVSQTQSGAYIYTLSRGASAEARLVSLGEVIGSMVRVERGLSSGDTVILDTDIVAGQKVKAAK